MLFNFQNPYFLINSYLQHRRTHPAVSQKWVQLLGFSLRALLINDLWRQLNEFDLMDIKFIFFMNFFLFNYKSHFSYLIINDHCIIVLHIIARRLAVPVRTHVTILYLHWVIFSFNKYQRIIFIFMNPLHLRLIQDVHYTQILPITFFTNHNYVILVHVRFHNGVEIFTMQKIYCMLMEV